MRYLITFSCYGQHLHGDGRGSVDRWHNLPGSRGVPESDRARVQAANRMDQPPYRLDAPRRSIVLDALKQVSEHRGWTLLAAHIRSTHVHAIVESYDRPEKIMNDFKSYSSRHLANAGDPRSRKRWARHGSTRWLWRDEDVREAVRYVAEAQGEPMAVYIADLRW